MYRGPITRTLAPPRVAHMPRNRALPLLFRYLDDSDAGCVSSDPLARDASMAQLEAVLLIADEPLPLRKLIEVAGLADAATARRLLKKLQAHYDADGSAFELEELAGGFQLM